jgi:DNA-binding NtrC family response regulator
MQKHCNLVRKTPVFTRKRKNCATLFAARWIVQRFPSTRRSGWRCCSATRRLATNPRRPRPADFVLQSERHYIAKSLDECDGHLGNTAALGINCKNLWGKMKKLELSVNKERA